MAIPQEGSRDTGDGLIVSVTPDVCKTPVGSSLVPIPYSITAVQGDDANTVASVRMTGKRAHNMASLVTKCTGDQPGTGLGVKSGTVESVCHPKSHSNNVRIRGHWAIRNDDQWWMNNRNTIGKLVYIESMATDDITPAIALGRIQKSQLKRCRRLSAFPIRRERRGSAFRPATPLRAFSTGSRASARLDCAARAGR